MPMLVQLHMEILVGFTLSRGCLINVPCYLNSQFVESFLTHWWKKNRKWRCNLPGIPHFLNLSFGDGGYFVCFHTCVLVTFMLS